MTGICLTHNAMQCDDKHNSNALSRHGPILCRQTQPRKRCETAAAAFEISNFKSAIAIARHRWRDRWTRRHEERWGRQRPITEVQNSRTPHEILQSICPRGRGYPGWRGLHFKEENRKRALPNAGPAPGLRDHRETEQNARQRTIRTRHPQGKPPSLVKGVWLRIRADHVLPSPVSHLE
jgi:hypothetical protein